MMELLLLAYGVLGGVTRGGPWLAERARRRRRLRQVTTLPRVQLATAPAGTVVRVVGTLAGRPSLIAPLTGRPCAYWEVEVRASDGHPVAWEIGPLSPFVVADDSGRAIVDPSVAEVLLDAGHDIGPEEHQAELAAFLAAHRLPGRSYRVREYALTSERPVTIVGRGVREADPTADHGYRDDLPTRLALCGDERVQLIITDRPPTP